MEYTEMNNGVKIPLLGYGVYQIPDHAECERCVLDALDLGYRLIDTAQAYGNEEAVGRAIHRSGIPRETLFITTKVWITNAGQDKAAASIDQSLEKLETDYIDLLLIHQPFSDYYGTYRAMEEAYRAGKVRAIGVSNFYPDRLVDLCLFADIVPAVNQVETHIFNQQVNARKTMAQYGVKAEAWGPFAEGKNGFFTNPVLTGIGGKYGKTAAQAALRFLVQQGVIVIPKSTHRSRMKENFDIFDFSLSSEDMQALAALDTGKSLFLDHYEPSTVEMLSQFQL